MEAGIEALPDRARDINVQEDERFGEPFQSDELPEELRRRGDRLAAIRAAKRDLEAEQREANDVRGREPGRERNPKGGQPYKYAYGEPDAKAQSNFTDPESAITRIGSEEFRQCCNVQVAVDGEHQLIVATEPTSNASDRGRQWGCSMRSGTGSGGNPRRCSCNERVSFGCRAGPSDPNFTRKSPFRTFQPRKGRRRIAFSRPCSRPARERLGATFGACHQSADQSV